MKLEDQVCSLELSKRLKELGVKQDSLIYWLNVQHCVHMKVKENGWEPEKDEEGNYIIDRIEYRIELGNPFAWNVDKDNCWSAFTVAELGEMLPAYINDNGDKQLLELSKYMIPVGEKQGNSAYSAEYWILKDPVYRLGKGCYEDNEADARAKMLIYLLENKLMELPNDTRGSL
jgi:hypothetical protein